MTKFAMFLFAPFLFILFIYNKYLELTIKDAEALYEKRVYTYYRIHKFMGWELPR